MIISQTQLGAFFPGALVGTISALALLVCLVWFRDRARLRA